MALANDNNLSLQSAAEKLREMAYDLERSQINGRCCSLPAVLVLEYPAGDEIAKDQLTDLGREMAAMPECRELVVVLVPTGLGTWTLCEGEFKYQPFKMVD